MLDSCYREHVTRLPRQWAGTSLTPQPCWCLPPTCSSTCSKSCTHASRIGLVKVGQRRIVCMRSALYLYHWIQMKINTLFQISRVSWSRQVIVCTKVSWCSRWILHLNECCNAVFLQSGVPWTDDLWCSREGDQGWEGKFNRQTHISSTSRILWMGWTSIACGLLFPQIIFRHFTSSAHPSMK